MSIKDITDYVRLTPGNTNPSVIGSMVQSEVNGTLKESKAYTDEQIRMLGESGQIGYEKVERIIVLPETTAEPEFIEDLGIDAIMLPAKSLINSNATLTITFDGVKYTCPSANNGSFGNLALIGEGEDTGEPFCGVIEENDGTAFVILLASTPGTHVVSIEATQKELLPMNPAWLPPIPNMENIIQLDSYAEVHTQLSDECSAEVNQIVAMNAPFFTAYIHIGNTDYGVMFNRVCTGRSDIEYVSTMCSGADGTARVNFFFQMRSFPDNIFPSGISLMRV